MLFKEFKKALRYIDKHPTRPVYVKHSITGIEHRLLGRSEEFQAGAVVEGNIQFSIHFLEVIDHGNNRRN